MFGTDRRMSLGKTLPFLQLPPVPPPSPSLVAFFSFLVSSPLSPTSLFDITYLIGPPTPSLLSLPLSTAPLLLSTRLVILFHCFLSQVLLSLSHSSLVAPFLSFLPKLPSGTPVFSPIKKFSVLPRFYCCSFKKPQMLSFINLF